MREIFTMWRHTQMVVLVALSAAIYAAVLIPFKGFTIIPGFTEVRPANVFPFVFGLLFGAEDRQQQAFGGVGSCELLQPLGREPFERLEGLWRDLLLDGCPKSAPRGGVLGDPARYAPQ